ncbi:MAG: ankyrin repeat domain-containing protein [Geodermatophilaceae bacterium]|nr:ankyrin repeat domain-containing protein [Geodermatophilaceae bacterium]MDQ3465313.1 ankyrin repeat domain-containing protein [Actinomycetota bacterium]
MPGELTEQEMDLLRQSFEWARSGDTARMTDLLDLGAPPNLTNERGDTLLTLAAYHCHLDMVRLLLDRGADVERVNDNGQTALGAAVFRRAADMVSLLLQAGADADTGPRSARTVARFFDLPDMEALLPATPDESGR